VEGRLDGLLAKLERWNRSDFSRYDGAMNEDRLLLSAFSTAGNLVGAVVYIVGIILAIVFWKRAPRASIFTIVGIALVSLMHTLSVIAPPLFMTAGASRYAILGAIGLIAAIGRAIGYDFFFAAIFSLRPEKNGPERQAG